ncbi:MAG: potassium transporter TrkG [Desulfobacterales bacterium]|nr:potassium transporter TrkG [Desulfobacterales bacterium]
MGFFDALCHTFTTMPTGGFSTKNTSVAHFNSVYIDMVFIVFMFLAGINFFPALPDPQRKAAGFLARQRSAGSFLPSCWCSTAGGEPRYLRHRL